MSGRQGGEYPGCAGRDGYESYDYGYNYCQDFPGLCASDTWVTSYPTPPSGGATHMGTARESYCDGTNRTRYSYSEPERGYGGHREQCPPHAAQPGWMGGPRGSFRGFFGSPPPVRGAGHPSSLTKQGAFPEMVGFQGLRAFTGNSYFGGGFKQRSKRSWKEKKNMSNDGELPAEKKLRMFAENSKSQETGSEGDGNAEEPERGTRTDGDSIDEEQEKTDHTESSSKMDQVTQSRRLGSKLVERIQFVCSMCKFRTFYDEEMSSHLQSEFHKEHFHYVGEKLPKQAADFLQEYVLHKTKKTEERRGLIEDLSTTIQQIYRSQDLTQGLGIEHFVKKVEAAHCAACDILIPMHFSALQRHVKSPLHNRNRRIMMENSKKTALAVARSILNNKQINQKLDQYIKGQNPFLDDHEGRSGCSTGPAPEDKDSEQPSCSTLFDSLGSVSEQSYKKEEREEEDPQDIGHEDTDDSV
ncbi:A-kinase anchor protein 8-like isoform X2 [Rhinoderma darwinii]|uniref:A-kinase anchor protein 8-like isoform X2 n=1 Tax=Rhinoderma darwinii TaxID=43563 RepID=UPI003F67ACB4